MVYVFLLIQNNTTTLLEFFFNYSCSCVLLNLYVCLNKIEKDIIIFVLRLFEFLFLREK